MTSLTEIGRHADEFLDYLKTILTTQPKQSVECVQQLLKALFGTNFASHSDDVVEGVMAFAESSGEILRCRENVVAGGSSATVAFCCLLSIGGSDKYPSECPR